MSEVLLTFAKGAQDIGILPSMANRHGLIAGATGTGKTVTLRVLAEAFSRHGIPVFMADIKGDLSGMAIAGTAQPKIVQRIKELAIPEFDYVANSVVFWDVLGESGHPIRTTISEMGPLLLARLLNLNETQAAVLTLIFKIADEHGLLLLDMKDLRAVVQYVGDNASSFKTEYGNISTASIGAIQRGLVNLEAQNADKFFGEPALNLEDFLQTDEHGNGVINLLVADSLMHAPKLYATFLLWMLSELFEILPEVGDIEKPKLVFFFDEAHLLFSDTPKALLEKIEQVVRLIRSKGVGIYFVTQNPLDIPETVLGQLGNRIQHALRAFTPRDQKAVRAAAETFRENPSLNTSEAIMELAVGEALISVLDTKGIPSVVERAWIHPPRSQLTPLTKSERSNLVKLSTLHGHYEKAIDRESAYELLNKRTSIEKIDADDSSTPTQPLGRRSAHNASLLDTFFKSAARAIGSQVGREIMRGVLGSLLGGAMGGGRRRR